MATEFLGATFSIDISDLKAGLNTANKLIRESRTEFQAASAGLDKYADAQQIAQNKIKSLTQIIPIQEEKVKKLKENYQKLVSEGMDETSNKAIDLRTEINRETKALEENNKELKDQRAALEELAKSSDEAGDEIKETADIAEKSSGGFTVLKGAISSLVADGFRMAISAAKDFVNEMVEVGKTFDDSMAQVGAVSGATGEDLDRLRDKAKEMGSTTKFTASEAADAFNYMAMAGWKTEDMLNGIEGILNLAAASGSDLATTSDIVTDALTAMGYSAGDAGRLADVMAAASSNANTNVEMMGMTFQYAAPIVGALGYSMEDTAVAIGLMANAGIKGEKSGTALRSILTRLSAPPSECAGAMDALGLSITKTDGTMKSLDEVMIDLRKAFKGLSETEQTAMAKHIAGQEAMSGLLAIVNAAPEDFDKLTEAVQKSEGAAENMANTMLDTLGGDMTVLNSQLEGVRLTIYEKVSPTLRGLVQDAQKWLSSVDWKSFGKKAGDALKVVVDYGKKFSKNVLPTITAALKVVGSVLKFVIDHFKTLAIVVGTAITVFKLFKAAMAVTTAITAAKTAIAGLTAGVGLATKAQTAWNAVMAANPIGAVVTAVALLAGGIALLVNHIKSASSDFDVLNESQRESVEAAKEAAKSFRDEKNSIDEMVGAQVANVDYVRDSLLPQLQDLIDVNGEVKKGEEARAEFILTELNKALGTEYDSIGDLVDQNGKLTSEIYNVIEAKKAQIMLEAYEEQYRDAIAQTAEAEKRRATEAQGLAKADELLRYAKHDLTNAMNDYNKAVEEGSYWDMFWASTAVESTKKAYDERKAAYDEQAKAYDDAVADAAMYYSTISSYESASSAILEGNAGKAVEILTNYGNGFKTASSVMKESADEQKRILGEQVITTETNLQIMEADYEKYSGEMTEEEKKQAQARIENARQQAEQAKVEFKKVGGQITQGMANGVEGSEWILSKAMQNTIDSAVAAAKERAGIKSPSRLFRDLIGKMIGLGIAEGIDDSTSSVVKSVKNQVNKIQSEYDVGAMETSVNAGFSRRESAGGVNNSRTVTVNQYNTYSQAHSRYEIYKSKQQTFSAVQLALAGV